MAGLSVAKLAAVAQMAEGASDDLLAKLAVGVAAMPGAQAAEFAAMLANETRDRAVRGRMFLAVMPLFRPRPDGVEAPHYPPGVLARLWKAVSAGEPDLQQMLEAFDKPEEVDEVADRLCLLAALRLRDEPALGWPGGAPEDIARLALMFEMAPMARRALPKLKDLVGRPNDDLVAELRLLFKDASDLAPDGAQRILDLLFAHIADAPLVLRIMVQSSGAASKEDFLSGSELAGFVDRLIAAMDSRVQRIEAFTEQAGPDAARQTIADVTWCADLLSELVLTVRPPPDSRWGKQAGAVRARIAKQMAEWLSIVDKRIDRALPLIKVRIAGSMTRPAPDVAAPTTGQALDDAMTLLTLVEGVRLAAGQFGCEGPRKQLVQGLSLRLSAYADELVEAINSGAGEHEDNARALAEHAAAILSLIGEAGPARTIRRRVAAAGGEVDAELRLASGGQVQ